MKPYFAAKPLSNKEIDVQIYGYIGWNNEPDGSNNVAYSFIKEFNALDEQYEKIHLHINSPGGSITEGLAIYNRIKAAKAHTITYNDGLIASMAGIIFLSGKERVMPQSSLLMVHQASTFTWGNQRDHEKTIEDLKTFNNLLAVEIALVANVTTDSILTKFFDGDDHYLTADECLALNMATKISDAKVKIPVPAQNLKNLSFHELVNLYNTPKESLLQKIVNTFTSQPVSTIQNLNTKPMNKFNLKFAPFLLALLAVDVLNKTEHGVELSEDQLLNIECKLQEISAMKAKIAEQQETIQSLYAQVTSITEKNNNKPVDNAAPTAITPDASATDRAEVSEKLFAYNFKRLNR